MTSEGSKSIEDIEVGDLVWSRNDVTGECGYKAVLDTIVTHPNELVHLEYGDDEELVGTAVHPFWVVESQSWVEMGDIRVGDTLLLDDGTNVVVTASWLEQAAEGESFTTYNLHVADWNTYYVSPAEDVDDDGFVWVHNLGGGLCRGDFARVQAKYTKYAATGRERAYLRRVARWTKASRADVVKLANSNNTGPGRWDWISRGRTGMAHQSKMTGMPFEDGQMLEYNVNGVWFDDFVDGVLIDHKGTMPSFLFDDIGSIRAGTHLYGQAPEEAFRQFRAARP